MDRRFSVRKVSNLSNLPNLPENTEVRVNVNPNGYLNPTFITDTLDLPGGDMPNGDRKKSFVHHTMEALPRVDNYRNDIQALKRPSLGELHGEEKELKVTVRNIYKGIPNVFQSFAILKYLHFL